MRQDATRAARSEISSTDGTDICSAAMAGSIRYSYLVTRPLLETRILPVQRARAGGGHDTDRKVLYGSYPLPRLEALELLAM